MIDLLKKKRPLIQQTAAEKMAVLKLYAERMLGAKWEYYRKIKHQDKGFSLLAEASLAEQMKATQSALKFTSKTASKAYWATFKIAAGDVKTKGGVKTGIPDVPEETEDGPKVKMAPEHDAFIIEWTPIKFLLNAKVIREKGVATQRHSEGLVAKLYFKVVGFYADPANWDRNKLCVYLRKVEADTDYQNISAALEPLKKDLARFCEVYEPFKFGQANLAKDAVQEADSFEDAMGAESFDDQLKSLYFYHFIYEGMEQFLLKYFAYLVFSTNNRRVIRYLATIFEPALAKAIENKNLFLGSFETDRTKKAFVAPYQEYQRKRKADPPRSRVEDKRKIYESWTYNLDLIERYALRYKLTTEPEPDSAWAVFARRFLLGIKPPPPPPPPPPKEGEEPEVPVATQEAEWEAPEQNHETRMLAAIILTNQLLLCSNANQGARALLLERFKSRVLADKETAQKRVIELKKKAEKKLREMDKKVKKLKRMKQEESVQVFQDDMEKFRATIEARAKQILTDAAEELNLQKRRLKALFEEVARERNHKPGASAGFVVQMTNHLDPQEKFSSRLVQATVEEIEREYLTDLAPLYENLFVVLHPSIQDKVKLIGALDKMAPEGGVRLTLTDDEKAEVGATIGQLKAKIAHLKPDLFQSKLIVQATLILVDDLTKLSLDNDSLACLLEFKATSPQSPKATKLPPPIVKALMVLNLVANPVPTNRIIQEGREAMTDPLARINLNSLTKLLKELETPN
ncbi:MAG: hypothetical protein A2508_05025 [Candidatus Lambdaproteobacteria bacterium RIFOXYD12_FULL_49_8]|nr:MAG: hypothetical protein A2508_05025 [Candidatus Lambdaproteobacteria bacterium RIFOXYD12_FULL_49_8]